MTVLLEVPVQGVPPFIPHADSAYRVFRDRCWLGKRNLCRGSGTEVALWHVDAFALLVIGKLGAASGVGEGDALAVAVPVGGVHEPVGTKNPAPFDVRVLSLPRARLPAFGSHALSAFSEDLEFGCWCFLADHVPVPIFGHSRARGLDSYKAFGHTAYDGSFVKVMFFLSGQLSDSLRHAFSLSFHPSAVWCHVSFAVPSVRELVAGLLFFRHALLCYTIPPTAVKQSAQLSAGHRSALRVAVAGVFVAGVRVALR